MNAGIMNLSLNAYVLRELRAAIGPLLFLCLFSARAVLASDMATITATRWPSLQEVLDKWRDTPVEAVTRAAEEGDLTAQHYLGYCYAEGIRFNQDSKAGVAWYERAAKAGYLPSVNNLGLLYERGKAVPQNYEKMLAYYRRAADAGYPPAQADLGFVYRDGLGVPRDFTAARKWFERAAGAGYSGAMVELGRAYRFGQGVPEDREAAEKWFRIAIEKGDSLGLLNLGLLYETESRYDKAFKLYQESAGQGQADAILRLYCCYWEGRGVAENRRTAKEWLVKAAEAGNAAAQTELAHHFASPQSHRIPGQAAPPASMPDAVKWYRSAADSNFAEAQCELGLCYIKGQGVEQSEEHGLEWIRKAADNGYMDALRQLVQLYARGIGEPRSEQDRPMQILRRITENRQAQDESTVQWAYDQIIFRHEYGVGTDSDILAGVEWYCRAALTGVSGYFLQDKIIVVPSKRRPVASFSESPERSLIELCKPNSGQASDLFLAVISTYLKAARANDSQALMQLGEMCVAGRGVPASATKAWLWFTLAARRGDLDGANAEIAKLESKMTKEELNHARQILPSMLQELNAIASAMGAVPGFQSYESTRRIP